MAIETMRTTDLADALERGMTLPASWYTSPERYAQEQERIFRRCWQYVGLTERVPDVGDFFAASAGDLPIFVTRDRAGALKAFVNVCRHRASQIVKTDCGHVKAFQCPYHAWTYGLDGTLKAAPGMRDEDNFDPACFSLFPLQIDTWGPFIFVNPDLDAPPLASILGQLPEFVDRTGLDLMGVKRRVLKVYDIESNWKAVVDNYLECYHCPTAHPGLTQLLDMNDYVIREYPYFSTQTGAYKQGGDELYDTRGEVEDGFYAFLWPNFTLNIYPGPGNLSLNLFLPMGPNRTRAIYEYCFADAVSKKDEDDFVRFIEQVQIEDIELVESVQKGLSTGYYQQGQLMLKQEQALRHFQRLVLEHLEG